MAAGPRDSNYAEKRPRRQHDSGPAGSNGREDPRGDPEHFVTLGKSLSGKCVGEWRGQNDPKGERRDDTHHGESEIGGSLADEEVQLPNGQKRHIRDCPGGVEQSKRRARPSKLRPPRQRSSANGEEGHCDGPGQVLPGATEKPVLVGVERKCSGHQGGKDGDCGPEHDCPFCSTRTQFRSSEFAMKPQVDKLGRMSGSLLISAMLGSSSQGVDMSRWMHRLGSFLARSPVGPDLPKDRLPERDGATPMVVSHADDIAITGPSGAAGIAANTDRGLLPDGLQLARTTPLFDAQTIPPALLQAHQIGEGVWGLLVVRTGTVTLVFDEDGTRAGHPAGGSALIAPGRTHHVELGENSSFVIEFHKPSADPADPASRVGNHHPRPDSPPQGSPLGSTGDAEG